MESSLWMVDIWVNDWAYVTSKSEIYMPQNTGMEER